MKVGAGAKALTKRFATLQACAALNEIALHAQEADNGRQTYIATRGALTKQFNSLEEVEAWLDRLPDVSEVN